MKKMISSILLCSVLLTFVGRDLLFAFEQEKDAAKVILTPSVEMKASPSMLAKTVGQLGQGEVLVVLERQGDWYRVCPSKGKTGWILAHSSPLISMAGVSSAQRRGNTHSEELYETSQIDPVTVAAEWGCATIAATALGAAVGTVAFLVLLPSVEEVPDGLGGAVAVVILVVLIAAVAGIAALASLPFGSAIGTVLVGGLANQHGSFFAALLGGGLGLLLGGAAGYGLHLVGEQIGQDWDAIAAIAIWLGPPTGAVVGYNLSRPRGRVRGSSLRFLEPPSLKLSGYRTNENGTNPKLGVNLVSLRF